MCRAINCKVCGKTTWAGCGQHVAMVKMSVPAGQWCNGKHTDAERAAAKGSGNPLSRFFSRLFGN